MEYDEEILGLSEKPVGHAETEWVKQAAYFKWLNWGCPRDKDWEIWIAAKNEFSEKFYNEPFPHTK